MLHCTVSPRLVNWDRIRNQQPGDMMNHRPFLNTFKLTRPSMDPSANHVAWSASDFEMFCMLPNSHVNLLTSSSIPPWTIENSISVFPCISVDSFIDILSLQDNLCFRLKNGLCFSEHCHKEMSTKYNPDNVHFCSISEIHCNSGSGTRELEGTSTSRPWQLHVVGQLLKKIKQLVREILVAHKICAWIS